MGFQAPVVVVSECGEVHGSERSEFSHLTSDRPERGNTGLPNRSSHFYRARVPEARISWKGFSCGSQGGLEGFLWKTWMIFVGRCFGFFVLLFVWVVGHAVHKTHCSTCNVLSLFCGKL